jgi:hypothetical protein
MSFCEQVLKEREASAKDQNVKQVMGTLKSTVRKRLKMAQSIMAKVYGDNI